jgi:hypothetical protein
MPQRIVRSPVLSVVVATALACWACGPEEGPPVSATTAEPTPDASAQPDPFAGMFQVIGYTVDQTTGDTRRIEGTVILVEKDGVYTATSDLATRFPSPGGPVHVDVRGEGEGRLEGSILSGTAETQLKMANAPGVDPDFAFIPPELGPRVVSTWTARVGDDGELLVELRNEPAEGESYAPTTTTLRGRRVEAKRASR